MWRHQRTFPSIIIRSLTVSSRFWEASNIACCPSLTTRSWCSSHLEWKSIDSFDLNARLFLTFLFPNRLFETLVNLVWTFEFLPVKQYHKWQTWFVFACENKKKSLYFYLFFLIRNWEMTIFCVKFP